MQICIKFSNKSLAGDVHVRVRGRIVQIPVRKPRITTVVPIPTKLGKAAPHIPIL